MDSCGSKKGDQQDLLKFVEETVTRCSDLARGNSEVGLVESELLSPFPHSQEWKGLHDVPREDNNWKLLIVDDEDEVHNLTRLVLRDYEFEDRGVTMLSAWSGTGARQIIRDNPDIAVILLDVVMECEDSGLRLVHYIRDELMNKHVRIILRTGQPGQAPELEVVARYDINDYKAKTELTSQKLYTTVTSALRSWRDIKTIDRSKQGLERVVDASGRLFEWHSRQQFAAGVLDQLLNLFDGGKRDSLADQQKQNLSSDLPTNRAAQLLTSEDSLISGLAGQVVEGRFVVVAGTQRFAGLDNLPVNEVVAQPIETMITKARKNGGDVFAERSYFCAIQAENGEQIIFLVYSGCPMESLDHDLIRIFMSNVEMAFHNVNLSLEILETQREIIHTLGEVMETRSKETANHVLRVGKMASHLAKVYGVDDDKAAILEVAAPLHDVGKVGIPDAILNKPGPLTEPEYEKMKLHTSIGYEILGKSERPIMQSAAIIALQHHEKWDGTGYPNGLSGAATNLLSRITALVDVFDALTSKRIYRDARDLQEVVVYLKSERGNHFDPDLLDCFLAHLTDFVGIAHDYPDKPQITKLAGEAKA